MNSVASTLNRVTYMEFNNQISVLTPNNWNTWKHDMQVLLMHYGCWQFIIQTKPEQPDEEATYKEKLDLQLRELGIKHEVTNSYTPEMNGVAERFNLTALDGIKTLLKSSEVPHKFWGEALLCFTYAWNRICHKDSNKTPFEKYSGRKPSVLHLKPFGCLAYAGVE
ncbi:retrovirus-related Pol polyprotein from transposon TNT 1-94 [Trichonephila clavipes]|nr:retrovirus-related Pol polyprotein from transposon TNT 1-94 [Trichonephila clavipes]